ncbi:MAG: glycosyltransferase family 4 protein [Solirubrobacteraceae bacterium]
MATQQLIGLTDAGVEIEAFVSSPADGLPVALRARPGLLMHPQTTRWRYDRWYSRADIAAHISGAAARAAHLRRIGADVMRRHAEQPFDAIYQFSMPELFALYGHERRLPPVVIHPEVHAAGELRWHRRERPLSRRSESVAKHLTVESMLTARSVVQRRDLARADLVIAPARRFAELLHEDCRVARKRLRVVANPVELTRFCPAEGPRRETTRRVLFVSRIAVRKGVETIVELSHRIADLEGQVIIEVFGDRSMWSDYRHLLADLHPATSVALGQIGSDDLRDRLRGATALLQPSHYEPFALTVAEALACGTPVISSNEVGATENVDPRVATRLAAGDAEALSTALRELLATVQDAAAETTLRAIARSEAERLFAPDVVGRQLASELKAMIAFR